MSRLRLCPVIRCFCLLVIWGLSSSEVFAQSFTQACSSPTIIDEGGSNNYNLNPGDVLLVRANTTPGSGVFTGAINNFPSGAAICVADDAVFMPTTFNNASGALYVRGEAQFPNIVVNAGFSLDNEGYVAFSAGLNINGEITVTNHADATLEIGAGTNLSSITLENQGTLRFPSGLNLNSGSLLNQGQLSVTGPADIGGYFVNTDRVDVDGRLTVNGNGDLYNSCVVAVNADIIFDSDAYNTGLLLAQTDILINSGASVTVGPDAALSSDSLTLNGEVNGSGTVRVEGYSVNQGSAVGDANNLLNVYDASQTNPPDYFDLQTGLVSNLERVALPRPDPNDPDLGCSLTPDPVVDTGSITIVKDSGTTDGAFAFAGDLGDFTLTTNNGSASTSFTDLAAGSYSVDELPLADWVLQSIACSDGSAVDLNSGAAAIELSANEHVTCTFTNALQEPPAGTIVIAKRASGPDATFSFTGDLGNFDLTTLDGNARQVFSGLTPGSFSVNEVVPTGWMLESIRCSGGQNVNLAGDEVTIDLPAGGGVACVFVNSEIPPEPGAVTITKNATGGDGLFSFSGDFGDFTLTTSAGTDSITFTDVAPGGYSVSEVVTGGWNLTDLSCDDSDSAGDTATATATINVSAGENLNCTFTNEAEPAPTDTIVISKIALGNDGTFTFSGDLGGGVFNMVTSGGHATRAFTGLPVGNYSIKEHVPSGWVLERIECTGDQTIDFANGEVDISLDGIGAGAACVFVNRQQRGSITIVKDSGANNGVFTFAGDLDAFTLSTTGGTASTRFDYLEPGTYSVTETLTSDWSLTDLSCDDGSSVNLASGTASIDLAAGEDVTCTFTNALNPPPEGTLVITKLALGGDASFAFDGELGAFNLATVSNRARQVFGGLTGDTYTVRELATDGWVLNRIRCSSGHVTDLNSGEVTVSLPSGGGAVCTFVNQLLPPEPASITIVKNSGSDPGTFTFNGDLGAFTLATNGAPSSETFDFLSAGTYTINEVVAAGWALDSVSCDGDSVVSGASATIELQAGDDVTCTYVNTLEPPPTGTIAIVKLALGDDGNFAFTGDLGNVNLATVNGHAEYIAGGLAPGSYTIAETAQSGWALNTIRCVGDHSVDLASGAVTVTLDGSGPGVACAFINQKLPPEPGSITIVKQTGLLDGVFGFAGDLGDFSLQTQSGTAEAVFEYLAPGTYSVSETLIPGWALSDLQCDNASSVNLADGSVDIAVAEGEDVTCTFTNSRRLLRSGLIAVGKLAIGADGTFAFDGSSGIGAFDVTTSDGTGGQSFSGTSAGDYTFTETVPAGWALTNIQCTGTHTTDLTSGSATVTLVDGGAGSACVFVNEPLPPTSGAIIVSKLAVGGDDSFSFSGDLGDFSLTTTGGRASRSFTDVAPGTYRISESAMAGWNVASVNCVGGDASFDGDRSVDVTVEAGQTLRCVFVNNAVSPPPPPPNPPAMLPVNSPVALALLTFLLLLSGAWAARRRGQ